MAEPSVEKSYNRTSGQDSLVAAPVLDNPNARRTEDDAEDDDSSNLFMSEPSISEVDPDDSRIHSPFNSYAQDEGRQGLSSRYSYTYGMAPPAPSPAARMMSAPGSPGNTSLSSWESPHLHRRIHLHFSPGGDSSSQPTHSQSNSRSQISFLWNSLSELPRVPSHPCLSSNTQHNHLLANKDPHLNSGLMPPSSGPATPERQCEQVQSSNSTSPASDSQLGLVHAFLNNLRASSDGKVKDTLGTNMSFGSSIFKEPIYRPLQNQGTPHDRRFSHAQNNANDTITMVLSDSETENSPVHATDSDSYDWDDKISADDEKTVERRVPRTNRVNRASATNIRRVHRRQMSAVDAEAVRLFSGTTEWKGMELHRIPMPPLPGGRYDDEDNEETMHKGRSKSFRTGALHHRCQETPLPDDRKHRVNGKNEQNVSYQFYGNTLLGAECLPKYRDPRGEYRRRKLPGLPMESDDSSSRMSMDLKHCSRKTRITTFPTTTFNRYMPNRDRPDDNWKTLSSTRNEIDEIYMHEGNPQKPPFTSSLNGTKWSSSLDIQQKSHSDYLGADNIQFRSSHVSGYAYSNDNEMSPLLRDGTKQYDGVEACQLPIRLESDKIPLPVGANTTWPHPNMEGHSNKPSSFPYISRSLLEKPERRYCLPRSNPDDNEDKLNTFVCPRCNTRQREFFSVMNAPKHFETTSGYIAFYFGLYVVAALYIFGLQEGWGKLDCIYFAGLGDFVPTSKGAKFVCSIYIYFGVACIGLLLGSYIAAMLDESSRQAAYANQIKSCPNCMRIQNIRDAARNRQKQFTESAEQMERVKDGAHYEDGKYQTFEHDSKRMKRQHQFHAEASAEKHSVGGFHETLPPRDIQPMSPTSSFSPSAPSPIPVMQTSLLLSPSTSQMLRLQSHSRHASMDLTNAGVFSTTALFSNSRRKYSLDLGIPSTRKEGNFVTFKNAKQEPPPPLLRSSGIGEGTKNDPSTASFDHSASFSSNSSSSTSSSGISLDFENQRDSVRNARYVFLTLREALVNSLVIIGTGCFGFYFIEGFSLIDSWYFTTVLLTTVGYGDLVPCTKGGKLFATIYILVAGTILLNNMSMISMIPLELRHRRIEKAVLTQFVDALDDSALRELATGPLIRRLNLATDHALDECTREMFCLAMLVRLGKVTEQDIKLTLAAFKKLDVHDEGVLNSRSIIAGMIQRRRQRFRTAARSSTPG